eukprot:scaffold203626_cov30-Tisochrysis_lutea.AAC.5
MSHDLLIPNLLSKAWLSIIARMPAALSPIKLTVTPLAQGKRDRNSKRPRRGAYRLSVEDARLSRSLLECLPSRHLLPLHKLIESPHRRGGVNRSGGQPEPSTRLAPNLARVSPAYWARTWSDGLSRPGTRSASAAERAETLGLKVSSRSSSARHAAAVPARRAFPRVSATSSSSVLGRASRDEIESIVGRKGWRESSVSRASARIASLWRGAERRWARKDACEIEAAIGHSSALQPSAQGIACACAT